jgi:hypothetical protein
LSPKNNNNNNNNNNKQTSMWTVFERRERSEANPLCGASPTMSNVMSVGMRSVSVTSLITGTYGKNKNSKVKYIYKRKMLRENETMHVQKHVPTQAT